MATMYIQNLWGTKLGDELSHIMEMLPFDDLAQSRLACRTWSSDMFAQRTLLLGRLADLLVARIKNAKHVVPAGSLRPGSMLKKSSHDESARFPTIVVDETLDDYTFDLLFGRQIALRNHEGPVELQFKKPADLIAAIPKLPPAVYDVDSNAPVLPFCPFRCWAGYADAQLKYDPAGSRFTLTVRSRVLKLSAYWEKTLDSCLLGQYLEA
jgi:hypothetical protein